MTKKQKKNLKRIIVALAAFIVLGRILAGVHWLTDILGGLLISLALYYAFKALNLKFF